MSSIAIDLDEDGKIDRWDFYDQDRWLERIGFSRSNDGTMDAAAFVTRDGAIERVEVSSPADTEPVAARARAALGVASTASTELTVEAVRDALTAAAARIGARALLPVEQPVPSH
ncbi:MAG: hypothetical protein HYU37_10495 [Acidobacteria bacterium]|nr:hypothetical protein [Acidobacteriota bacterium]